jgi:peptidyl-prolyl cis-trans isomerase SurA
MILRVLAAAFGASWLLLHVTDAAAAQKLVNRVIAIVNDDVVLLDELEEAAEPLLARIPKNLDAAESKKRIADLRNEILETLIADKLLEQEVKVLKIEVGEREIDRLIKDLRERNNLDDQQLEQALLQQGMTMAEYRDGMRKQLLKMKIINLKVRSKVQVSDQDVQSLYQRQQDEAAEDVQIHARHIVFLLPEDADADLVAAKLQQATAAARRAKAGEDFAALAQELSEGPNAAQGGDLGFFRREDIVEAFAKAAFVLKPGDMSEPVRTPFGWHVIKVEERRSGDVKALDELKDQLKERLYQEEIEVVFRRYVDELRKAAYVETRLDADIKPQPNRVQVRKKAQK